MNQLGMAVVGVGTIGSLHARIINESNNAKLVAICDLNEELGREIATSYGCKFYRNIHDLASDNEVEAVSICVNEEYHLDPTIILAKSGKHILLEKPIAINVEISEKIKHSCDQSDVRLMIGQTTNFLNSFNILKNKYEANELGEIIQLSIKHLALKSCGEFINGRTSMMFYLGVHDIFSIQWITGRKIKQVYAQKTQKIMAFGEDCILIMYTLDNDAIGTLEVGWHLPDNYPADLLNILLIGTKGTANLDTHLSGFKLFNSEGFQNIDLIETYEINGKLKGALTDEIIHFIECINENKPFYVSTEDAIDAIRVIEGVFESLETGLPVKIIR